MTVKAHYENHLAAFHTWMTGDPDEAGNRFTVFRTDQVVYPAATGLITEMAQTIGFSVTDNRTINGMVRLMLQK